VSSINYPDCLRDLIESEIFGEAVSLALLDVARTDRDGVRGKQKSNDDKD
jgi:hypothetical protein